MEEDRSYHFDHWLHVSKKKVLCALILCGFRILYMFIALAGADNPFWPICLCQQEGLITLVIVACFKHISSASDVILIFL